MRKIFLIIISLVLTCFLIPLIFTKPFEVSNPNTPQADPEEKVEKIEKIKYDYRQFNIIKLYHTKTEQIEEVSLDEYLYNVVSAEMPVSFDEEALKAQAVVARTYTIYQITKNQNKHGEANICDSSACCQAWISKEDRLARWDKNEKDKNWEKIVKAVNSTSGKIITYEGEPINAFFHSNSGGMTEIPLNVWGGNGYPYLQTVETSGEDGYTQYYSEIELTKEEVITKIKQKHGNVEINYELEDAISILEYTQSGRVKTIKFGNVNLSGVEARTIFGLKSANFTIQVLENTVKFTVLRIWTWSRNESNGCR